MAALHHLKVQASAYFTNFNLYNRISYPGTATASPSISVQVPQGTQFPPSHHPQTIVQMLLVNKAYIAVIILITFLLTCVKCATWFDESDYKKFIMTNPSELEYKIQRIVRDNKPTGRAGSGCLTEYEIIGNLPKLLQDSAPFRKELAETLYDTVKDMDENDKAHHQPLHSVFWEFTPMSLADVESYHHAKFCVMKTRKLHPEPDFVAFEKQFETSLDGHTASFWNLGNDAMLVVPLPTKDKLDFADLSNFLRYTNHEEGFGLRDKLFQSVGEALKTGLESQTHRKLWLSTSGSGVAYLHVRLDTRPKYYSNKQYAEGKV
mmetsp:Transcript_11680/g.20034  ORF Transcript_11680/g.20034 Transcript_11680/m.20034 type:complete len:320 (+) Transcript_11680:230-1189(+)